MFVNYLRTKFHMPCSSGSLVFHVKPKTKYIPYAHAALFYITEENTSTKITNFSKIYYHISFQCPILSGTSVTRTSNVYVSAVLLPLKCTRLKLTQIV